MPFNAALSAPQITQVRKTSQAFEHYLLVNPNDIVWQAEVDENKTGENYVEFDWTNTLQGNRANVMQGQVLLVTTSDTDFSNPVIRGRVRLVPDATDVFINEVGTDITNSMYVTVIDDFDIMERLQRLSSAGLKYKDWEIPWEDLPPVIDGLQSVYADFSGSDPVAFSFSPTATAVASGAAISSWSWDIDDGSFTGGSISTDQNITCTFPGYGTNEHRWVHLTVTDDNGNSTTFHFEVYTVHKQSSTAVKLDTGELSITGTIEEGWNATITAWDGMALTEVLDQTRCAIAGIDDYDGTATPIVSNIMMVGRFRNESDITTADERASSYSETSFQIEGFGTQLARLPAPALSIVDTASPDDWGEVTNPTPFRAIIYFLAFHTTYITLSSISTDDLTGYVLGDFSLGESTALDNCNRQMESVNGITAFAPSGETTFRRMASYMSNADRAGLTTVFDFTTADITPDSTMEFEYGEQVGEIEAGAVVYNTTDDEIEFRYIGRAPAMSFGSGHEAEQLNGQALKNDSTDANARTELTQRTADHLAYINPKVGLTVGLMDGFWFIIPTLHQRWTFTFAATDTARGRVYTSSDYWQLISVDYVANADENSRELSATFIEETQGENAGVSVTLIPDPNDLDYSLPPLGAYDTFPDDGLTNFPTDSPNEDPYYGGGMAAVMEPDQNNQEAPANCETLNIPMYGEYSRGTTRNTTFGETYTITSKGDAQLNTSAPAFTVNFSDATKYSFVDLTGEADAVYLSYNASTLQAAPPAGSTSGGNAAEDGGVYDSGAGGASRYRNGACAQTAAFDAPVTVEEVSIDIYRGAGTKVNGDAISIVAQLYDIGGARIGVLKRSFAFNNLTWSTETLTAAHLIEGTMAGVSYVIAGSYNTSGLTFNNDFFVDDIVISVDGDGERGDSFYTDYIHGSAGATLYGAGLGLLINAAKPGTIPQYQGNHEYVWTHTGTGAPFSFKFKLTDYSEVSRNVLTITVCGDNMGVTT